jgi:predicted Zn-dependent protease
MFNDKPSKTGFEINRRWPVFVDGQTSVNHQVNIQVNNVSLRIIKNAEIVATWAFDKVHVKEDWHDETGAILGYRDTPDAGLSIYQKGVFQRIQQCIPKFQRASYIIPHKSLFVVGLGIAAIASIFILLPFLKLATSALTFIVPYAVEKKLGDIVVEDMARDFEPCDDEKSLAMLTKISNRLMPHTEQDKLQAQLHLYKEPQANAFSLPGGHIAVLSGLLWEAQTEDELAAVIAHEMGHMVKRDALSAYVQAQGLNIIGIMVGSSGAYGGVAELASFVQILRYSRELELEADDYAVKVLTKAGYSTQGLSTFLTRMENETPEAFGKVSEYMEILSTHPNTAERVKRIDAQPKKQTSVNTISASDFMTLKTACQ